jgi:hypothetical protein
MASMRAAPSILNDPSSGLSQPPIPLRIAWLSPPSLTLGMETNWSRFCPYPYSSSSSSSSMAVRTPSQSLELAAKVLWQHSGIDQLGAWQKKKRIRDTVWCPKSYMLSGLQFCLPSITPYTPCPALSPSTPLRRVAKQIGRGTFMAVPCWVSFQGRRLAVWLTPRFFHGAFTPKFPGLAWRTPPSLLIPLIPALLQRWCLYSAEW